MCSAADGGLARADVRAPTRHWTWRPEQTGCLQPVLWHKRACAKPPDTVGMHQRHAYIPRRTPLLSVLRWHGFRLDWPVYPAALAHRLCPQQKRFLAKLA